MPTPCYFQRPPSSRLYGGVSPTPSHAMQSVTHFWTPSSSGASSCRATAAGQTCTGAPAQATAHNQHNCSVDQGQHCNRGEAWRARCPCSTLSNDNAALSTQVLCAPTPPPPLSAAPAGPLLDPPQFTPALPVVVCVLHVQPANGGHACVDA